MVSFGDMMTLILTFFILLVSMSHERKAGLVAKGVGSFVVAVRSFGLNGVLDATEELAIFDNIRIRFNLPPESDPDRQDEHASASNLELIRATLSEALAPHDELNQPNIATFGPDSSELSDASMDYIDLLTPTLRPSPGQVLVLEGHALDAGPNHAHDNHYLGFSRAEAIRKYLIEHHGFNESRVHARSWLAEIEKEGIGTRSVDGRLITPTETEK